MSERFTLKPAAILTVGVILVILYAGRSVVTPLLAAFLVAFIFEPVVGRLSRRIGRTGAVIVTFSGLILITACLLVFLAPLVIREAVSAADQVQANLIRLEETLRAWMAGLPEETKAKAAEALSAFSGKLLSTGASLVGRMFGFLSGVAVAISKLVLFVVGVVFLMLDFHLLRPGLLDVMARLGIDQSKLDGFAGFLSETGSVFRAFFRGQLLYAAALGALSAIGLYAIGLPYGLTLGMAVGILSLVPYVGVSLGLVIALAISAYTHGELVHLALTAGVFGLVQLIDAVYLTPKLLGGVVGLHPLLAVIALLSFSQLFGVFGLMLAIPLAAVTIAAFRRLLANEAVQ